MLKARVIFWVTMCISALVAVIYLSLGFSDTGMSLLFGLIEFESELNRNNPVAETLYVGLFSNFIAGIWLSVVAIILALISCASIFPDAMDEGAAGVLVTKSLGRVGIFFTKYVGSLFFVAIQVGLFCLIVFFALRWRVGSWNPSIFWFIPIVVLVFSYIYSVLVLVAVKTRSVLVAILIAMGFWFLCALMSFGEGVLYRMKQHAEIVGGSDGLADVETINNWHRVAKGVYGVVPKTGPTMGLADRLLVVNGERGFSNTDFLMAIFGPPDRGMPRDPDQGAERHSVAYVLGTSLLFEGIILSLAAWLFCRRDF
jgi:ABC-type transport system involved in multi-copper enzyme maturation permease subunit